jgi:hypothetical protein
MSVRNRVAIMAALAGALSIPVSNSIEIGRRDEEIYSLGSLGFRSAGSHPTPKASQAKKRRLARRMHCGHIKNLRLRT